jgi:uncharacterized C2H2 Zn-finger protein
MVTKLEPISVETFAANLSISFLACRELGHNWKPWRAAWSGELRAYERELRCPRCKTVRRQLVNDLGHVLSNSYRYPDGYQAKDVEHAVRVSRDVFRLEALTRYLSDAS